MKRVIVALSIFISGCMVYYDYEVLTLKRPNPTSYVFNASVDKIKRVLVEKIAPTPSYDNTIRYAKGGRIFFFVRDNLYDSFKYLNTEENLDDAIIEDEGSPSYVYYNKEEPIVYSVKLHIHFKALSPDSTLVEIRAINPNIQVGYHVMRALVDMGMTKTKEVPPSTIEEYQLLLAIGEGLGMKDQMPKLILPNLPTE
jgi:hypothetical protein